jgi:SAM-dependent methyltransferase
MTLEEQREAVALNVRAYRSAWRTYDRNHGEIFNDVEQERLRGALERAVADNRSSEGTGGGQRALDVGSGTGNVTRHLVELGLDVTAADVSPELLGVVTQRFPAVRTQQLGGLGLPELDDASFDLVTAYSVLHHVPDYRPRSIFCVEGDIHTWAEDHIEWFEVEQRLGEAGAEVVWTDEYLVYRADYARPIWEAYRERCGDMRTLVARKATS